jgi:anti-anti-sigma factor
MISPYSHVPTTPFIDFQAERPGVMRIRVTGVVDMDTAPDLFASLLWCSNDPSLSHVNLDMRDTTFIDSSGIRAIMEGHHAATMKGQVLRVVDWSLPVRRVFETLGLADALQPEPEAPQ